MKPSREVLIAVAVLVLLFIAFWTGFFLRPVSYFHGLLYIQMNGEGAHSHWVDVNGHHIHYYEAGTAHGPAVVLVHGLGGRSEDWKNLLPSLLDAGYHVYLPDLPGYGRSQQPQDFSYSIEDEAAAVVGFMDALGLRQVDLGGWSMGGWIVQRIAYEHPERVRKLMLFDSAGLHVAPTWNTELFTPNSPAEMNQLLSLLMPHPPQTPPFVINDMLRQSRSNAWIIHRALSSMLDGRDTTDDVLPKLHMPLLIVWGAEDRITPPGLAEKIHQLVPQSQVDVVPGCGHLAPSQCADRIAPAVTEFLSR